MKTEQEQIKAIKQIIDERVETTLGQVQGRHDNVIKTVDTVIIARDIVNAGYGDVSEYKAEIERLESENEKLKTKCDDLKKLSDWQREDIKILKAEVNKWCDNCETIKQGQVDVLKELKTQLEAKEQHYICMYDWDGHSAVVDCANEVDELIKEVEDD